MSTVGKSYLFNSTLPGLAGGNTKIVLVNSVSDAQTLYNYLDTIGSNIVTVDSTIDYTAFSPNSTISFVYKNSYFNNFILDILMNHNITKLISQSKINFKLDINNFKSSNIEYFYDYLYKHNLNGLLDDYNKEINNTSKIYFSQERIGTIILIMSKYKEIAFNINSYKILSKKKQKKRNIFNNHRDCYLLYLTAFNDILLRSGPLLFDTLLSYTYNYPFLCRIPIGSKYALNALINIGALFFDNTTFKVSLPDHHYTV